MDLQHATINVLGDSITAGSGVTDPEHIYHAVLGHLVGADTVRNYGIGGTRIARQSGPDTFGAAFVDRYTEMADDADLVLVFGGTNDYGHGNAPFGTTDDRTPETFCGACHLLFAGLIEKYPTTPIVVMTPIQRLGGNVPSGNTGLPLVAYADKIREIAGFYALPVLDLYRCSGICPDLPVQQQRFCPDGLHPNNDGAARIAARLAGFLQTL